MKRTSLWIALLALTPTITQAWHTDSLRYRVRYSPYARDYHHSGLIPGGLRYSPYAQGPGRSGLVYERTRYTPYALSYDDPGLVVDYYVWPISRCAPVCVQVHSPRPRRVVRVPAASRRVCGRSSPATRQTSTYAKSGGARGKSSPMSEENGLQVIRQYLDSKNVGNVGINHVLRIDGHLVTANFILRDRNLILTYWNPEEIESLAAKADFKQKAFERYRKNWQRLAEKHESNGGQIYYVEASGRERILAALESCGQLDPGGDVSQDATLYAKQ